jgi:Raf kinase inhibitor-like YbhB/YbcL family protein
MKARFKIFPVTALMALFVAACGAGNNENPLEVKINIQLTSTAFADGQPIPQKYTCDGSDVSPQLAWTGAPPNTKSFALIADDPDAPVGTWVHWVIYNLPPDTTALAEDTPKSDSLPNGAKQGLNDFKNTGYGGPCPPPGKPHRYFFKLYVLDTAGLPGGLTKKQLLKAMDGHILAQGQLMGTY